MLFSGDSAQDKPDGRYECLETFIAVGCQSGKVSVYNVLGLLIYEIYVGASVVALEWVGDMTGPSVLPSCKRLLSTCVEEEEDPPMLKFSSRRYESLSNEEPDSGTIKKKAVPTKRSDARSPIRFDGGKDLFSPDIQDPCLNQENSEIIYSPAKPARQRSFLRPRIVTETFQDPSAPCAPRKIISMTPKGPNMASIQEALKKTDSRHVFDVFFSDALRMTRSVSPSASSVYSQSSCSSDIWMTPPTNQKPTGRSNPVGYKYPSSFQSPGQTPRPKMRSRHSPPSPNFSRPLRRMLSKEIPSPPSRKVSFVGFNHPPDDGQDQSTALKGEDGLEERTPLPAPPEKHAGRDFSFEVGLHEQEKKCEREFRAQENEKVEMEVGNEIGWLDERNPNLARGARKRKVASVGMSVDECELRLEHRRLRQEMAMLREEFRALREVLGEVRR